MRIISFAWTTGAFLAGAKVLRFEKITTLEALEHEL